ncbi:hypothetical protein DIPPA_10392 [Diplonema papillatum]|nr:hypothetical protein DIPPA_10392 [Diplonema papillatum]
MGKRGDVMKMKKYHVWNMENRLRVEEDEAKHAESKKRKRANAADQRAKRRYEALLEGRQLSGSDGSASPTDEDEGYTWAAPKRSKQEKTAAWRAGQAARDRRRDDELAAKRDAAGEKHANSVVSQPAPSATPRRPSGTAGAARALAAHAPGLADVSKAAPCARPVQAHAIRGAADSSPAGAPEQTPCAIRGQASPAEAKPTRDPPASYQTPKGTPCARPVTVSPGEAPMRACAADRSTTGVPKETPCPIHVQSSPAEATHQRNPASSQTPKATRPPAVCPGEAPMPARAADHSPAGVPKAHVEAPPAEATSRGPSASNQTPKGGEAPPRSAPEPTPDDLLRVLGCGGAPAHRAEVRELLGWLAPAAAAAGGGRNEKAAAFAEARARRVRKEFGKELAGTPAAAAAASGGGGGGGQVERTRFRSGYRLVEKSVDSMDLSHAFGGRDVALHGKDAETLRPWWAQAPAPRAAEEGAKGGGKVERAEAPKEKKEKKKDKKDKKEKKPDKYAALRAERERRELDEAAKAMLVAQR